MFLFRILKKNGDIVMWIGFFDEKDNTAAINIKALFADIKKVCGYKKILKNKF